MILHVFGAFRPLFFRAAILGTATLMLSLILFSCVSTEHTETSAGPALSEVVLDTVKTAVTEGRFEAAIQDIDRLRRDGKYSSGEELDILYRDSVTGLRGEFGNAVESGNYRQALRIYRSLSALSFENVPEGWSESLLYLRRAENLASEGSAVSALAVFLQALREDELSDAGADIGSAELDTFASLALEHGSRSVLEDIVSAYDARGYKPPEKYSSYLAQTPDSRSLVSGTVTILVNRGIRIQKGVGYPDRVIGSGFFIDRRGYLITNYHVIESEVSPSYEGYSRLFVTPSGTTRRIPAQVVGYDRIFDIALLKVEMPVPYVYSFSDVERLSPGERIFAIGSPGGLENTITSGIVSATGRRFLQMGDAVQIDVPVNPGNSGGPLLNERGDLIGFVFAGLEQFEGINFAIPSYWIVDMLPDLYEEQEVTHAWLGISVVEEAGGLEVVYVLPGSHADRAGIRAGDLLLSLHGMPLSAIREAQKELLAHEPGTLVNVSLRREGRDLSLLTVLGERPFSPVTQALKRDTKENVFAPLFGMKVTEAGGSIWAKNYLVEEVYQGSVADETGISENDPFSIQEWIYNEEERFAMLRIHIKKRKAGFLESVIQLAAYLDNDSFL